MSIEQKIQVRHDDWRAMRDALQEGDRDPELIAAATQWLKDGDPNHESWALLWEALPRHDRDRELVALATQWLKDVNPNHGSWAFVWLALPRHDSNPDLVALATQWLKDADPNHSSWALVSLALSGSGSDPKADDAGLGMSISWLRSVSRDTRPTARSRRWVDDDERTYEMYELYEQGAGLEEVGICFGLTRERVRQIFVDAGLPLRSRAESGQLPKYPDAVLAECLQLAARALDGEVSRGDYDMFARKQRLSDDQPWPSSQTLVSRLGSWRDALRAAGVRQRIARSIAKRYSDAELLDCLRKASSALGCVLTHTAYNDFARNRLFPDGRAWPGHQTPSNRFGSWTKALDAAGLQSNLPSAMAGHRRFDQTDCIRAVRSAAQALAKTPTNDEYDEFARNSDGALPSVATIRKRCGTWTEAIRMAGL